MRVGIAITVACALIVCSTVARAQYAPGQPYPGQPYGPGATVYVAPGQAQMQPPQMRARIVHRTRPGLWITGIALLGVGYLAFLPVSSVESPAIIPIAGPWIVLGTMDCSGDFEDLCGIARFFVAFDGLMQLAGGILLTLGLVGHDVTVYDAASAEGPTFRVTPWMAREAAGMALSATM